MARNSRELRPVSWVRSFMFDPSGLQRQPVWAYGLSRENVFVKGMRLGAVQYEPVSAIAPETPDAEYLVACRVIFRFDSGTLFRNGIPLGVTCPPLNVTQLMSVVPKTEGERAAAGEALYLAVKVHAKLQVGYDLE